MNEDVKISQKQRGMKWYNFIVKFQLWLIIIAFFAYALLFLTGQMYDDAETAAKVYIIVPAMKTVDILYGIISFACAACAFVIRKQLLNHEKNSPRNYIIFSTCIILFPLFYDFAISICTNVSVFEIIGSDLLTLLIACILNLICNTIYFYKRRYMFGAAGIRYKE